MSEENLKVVEALKDEIHEIRHEAEIMELRLKNFYETIELKLDRIDRIEAGGINENSLV